MPVKSILTQLSSSIPLSLDLQSISVIRLPKKLSYVPEEEFDPTGMIIAATYQLPDSSIVTFPITNYTITPDTTLAVDDSYVTISYTENGKTVTTTVDITVKDYVVDIRIDSLPNKTVYEYGDTFDDTGLVTYLVYESGREEQAYLQCVLESQVETNTWPDSVVFESVGTVGVAAVYEKIEESTVEGVEAEAIIYKTFNVTVERKSVPKPSWKGSTFTFFPGVNRNVASSTYWNNFNTRYFTIGGTTIAQNAGIYTVIFTPKDNYRWNDKTTDSLSLTWTINKASRTLTLNPSTINLTTANSLIEVNFSYPYSGKDDNFTLVEENGYVMSAALTSSPTGEYVSKIIIRGDGSTPLSNHQVTITIGEGPNYLSCSAILTINASYTFEWGDENAIGDATWWSKLKTYVASGGSTAGLVGKQKKVVLTNEVLGTTTHMVRCIGTNQDGNNTITFQTSNCLASPIAFSSQSYSETNTTGANYGDSRCQAKIKCDNYYDAFPGKASIKQIEKTFCSKYNDKRDNIADVAKFCYVFLPSEQEMGLNQYSPSRMEQTYGITNYGYSYYSNASKRIKKLGDTGSTIEQWERSRGCYSSSPYNVCCIDKNGNPDLMGYDNEYGISPAFVIG